MYHDVAASDERERTGFPGSLAARYKLTPGQFAAHLDAISATCAAIGLFTPEANPPAAAITFDDGGSSALAAARMLEERGWRGHFFVTTAKIGSAGFLDADGIRELASRGHVIGSHSHTHPTYMGRLPASELDREWCSSREILAEILGRPPEAASVPGGFLSRLVAERARKAGYGLLMTSEPTTRISLRHGIPLVGRFTIWATTDPGTAAAYVAGSGPARLRLWLEWNAKKAAKTVAPNLYEAARHGRAAKSR